MPGGIAGNRSAEGIHEDLSTVLMLLSRKECIFRGALNGVTDLKPNNAVSCEKKQLFNECK